jgi:acyl-CoA synthetase (AMP-forming)/AMP-acid ligase II
MAASTAVTTSSGHGANVLVHQDSWKNLASSLTSHVFPDPQTIEKLLYQRCHQDGCDRPIVAYPASGTEYAYYTPLDLNALIEKAIAYYSKSIAPRSTSGEPTQVIGLLGLSNLEYMVSLMAISRMGHTVLFLSTRISEEAYISLLTGTKTTTIIIDSSFVPMAEAVKGKLPDLQVQLICDKNDLQQISASPYVHHRLSDRETMNIAWIIHSSGSTGLPKPIFQTHKAAVHNYTNSFGLVGFVTLPLFHAHGISCLFRGMHSKKLIYVHNAALPLTKDHLISTLRHEDIRIFYSVPYALKLLSETEEGIALLANLEIVMFGGSPCPKPIGDKLVKNGVFLVSHYGSTETGQLMTSFRPREDKDWDYVRPSAALKPLLKWDERYPGIYELSVKEGWPSKVISNCEDGSYATKDLFEIHPTTPDAYRYYARLDDTIILMNGEKANPLLVEGVARENALVSEAVVFGHNKPYLGLFVFPADANITQDQVVESLWPALDATNERIPSYARLSKDMIICLQHDAEYRKTDKGTIIRAAFYKQYADVIESAYEEYATGTLILPKGELAKFLKEEIVPILRLPSPDVLAETTDLFSIGMDSLQATQLRQNIIKKLDTGGHLPGQNFAFDFPTLQSMEKELLRLSAGEAEEVRASIEIRMEEMIARHSTFESHIPRDNDKSGQYIVSFRYLSH